jgi:hypothetical protein
VALEQLLPLELAQAELEEQVLLLMLTETPDYPEQALPLELFLLHLAAEPDLVGLQPAEQQGLLSWHQTRGEPQQQMAVLVELGCRSQRILQQCAEALVEALVEELAPQMPHFKVEQEGVRVL